MYDHKILINFFNYSVAKTQASIPEEIREQLGIFESSIRLSVGLENADDLIHDLEQALKRTYEEYEVESNWDIFSYDSSKKIEWNFNKNNWTLTFDDEIVLSACITLYHTIQITEKKTEMKITKICTRELKTLQSFSTIHNIFNKTI